MLSHEQPMYLKSFAISNAKCFSEARLPFPCHGGDYAGWNVVLGVNGTGKSTLLQAMALTMLGPVSGGRLLLDPAAWVRGGSGYVRLQSELVTTTNDTSAGAPRKSPYQAHLVVTGTESVKLDDVELNQPQVALARRSLVKSLNAGPYSNRRGWFSAGYGPFRRLTGTGSEDDMSIAHGQIRASRHLTLFRESAALTRCEKWLIDLYSQSHDPNLKSSLDAAVALDRARILIDGLLPAGLRIRDVNSVRVTFATQTGVEVSLDQLSDGYRSFLALSIDLLRHILEAGEHGDLTIDREGQPSLDTEGVVLIDEADAHLHPSWQRDIGFRMCAVFPKLQFIVSTHSPFVAQAARNEGIFIMRAQADGTVIVERSDFSVRGWRADQILLSPLFGLDSTRDVETEQLLARHAELKGRRRLSPAEGEELEALERKLSGRLTAPGDSLEERERQAKMDAYIDDRLGRLEREKRA